MIGGLHGEEVENAIAAIGVVSDDVDLVILASGKGMSREGACGQESNTEM
jgi:hypothetical protein